MLEDRDQVERKLREKMRVYPGTLALVARRPEQALPDESEKGRSQEQGTEKRRHEDARRTAIVSLFGKDLSSAEKLKAADAKAKRRRKAA